MTISLTTEQEAVVQHRGSPLRVVAGPGTGKTSCIAARICNLVLKDHVESKRILAVTFTRAAAGETRQKLEKHGIKRASRRSDTPFEGSRTTRHHSARLGLSPAVRPLSKLEEKILMKDVAADLAGLGVKPSFKGTGTVSDYFRAYQSEQTGAGVPAWVSGNTKNMAAHRQFATAYEGVQTFYSSIDWVRVVNLAVGLLNAHPDILGEEQARIDYLLVDEYQDLNRADQQFVLLLIGDRTGLCIVGDEDQSIYESQRYAAPSGLIDFHKSVPGTVTLPLTLCHRCPSQVLEKANALISHNTVRMAGKPALRASDLKKKGVVATVYHKSKKAEVKWLVEKIIELHKKGFQWRDVLILFSEGQIAEDYIADLRDKAVPLDVKMKIAGPFDTTCFASVLATCQLLANQADNMAVRQCLEYWPNVGAETIRRLRSLSQLGKQSLWKAVEIVATNPDAHRSIARRRSVSEFHVAMTKLLPLRDFREIIPTILKNLPDCVTDPGVKILEKYFGEQGGKEAVMGIREVLGNFENERESGRFDMTEEELPDKVRVMSMHSAKGLEARVVFMPALEDDLMPGLMGNLEERRRLFYVSITRSKEILGMSWASQRTGREIHRTGGRMLGKTKSRFLKEMSE